MVRVVSAALPFMTVRVRRADVTLLPAGILFWVSNFSIARR